MMNSMEPVRRCSSRVLKHLPMMKWTASCNGSKEITLVRVSIMTIGCLNTLGSGTFGDAYLALNLETGEHYVVKQIRFDQNDLHWRPDVLALQHEISSLQTLSHPNIVRYICTTIEGTTLNIFQEFVPGGSIASVLERFGAISEKVIRLYTRQILTGLEYLHTRQIIHRTIKVPRQITFVNSADAGLN